MEASNEHIKLDSRYLLLMSNFHLTPRPAKPNLHSHHYLEISCVKAGKGEYLMEDKLYDVREGDVFIFNNIEKHGIGVYPPDELVNLTVMFDPRFIWSIESNLFDARYLKIFFDRSERFENRLDRNNPTTKEIAGLIHEMEQEFLKKDSEYELMIKVKLLNILVALIRYYRYTASEAGDYSSRKRDITCINKAIDHIDRHLGDEIRLRDLSGMVYMNPSYFSTFFKKYVGLSPSEYMMRKRIHRSIEYLKSTDHTILKIASLCGFNSASSFNKAFRKITAKAPSDFRT